MIDEPAWMNPAHDRRTPYSDEELDRFVDGFIQGLDEPEWSALKSKHGEDGARRIIKAGFIAGDPRNLINLETEGGAN